MSWIVHRYLHFTAGSKGVVHPCELIWNWTPQATMTMQAMRCAEEACGLYYYFDSSRELLCNSLPWVFFQRSFSLSGSCSTGQLVAACGSCVSHLPRYIIDWHLLLSLQFSRIKEGVAATQLPGRLFSQRLHFAMQSEWECRKVYFRPCMSHVILQIR